MTETDDRRAIRDLIVNWAIWRDAGRWDEFRTLWHQDGVMMATWFQGGIDDFIAASSAAFARGARAWHDLGGSAIDVAGSRAVADTAMTIAQRAEVEGVLCEVACQGRFYDFLEKRAGRWGFVLRQPIYERDALIVADPGASPPQLDAALLARFPKAYRHLAYVQTKAGQNVKADMPGPSGPERDAVTARGAAWLSGAV